MASCSLNDLFSEGGTQPSQKPIIMQHDKKILWVSVVNPDSTRLPQLPRKDSFEDDLWCFTSEDACMRLCLPALVAKILN